MGLCTNIEKWQMPAAIGMATEAIRAKYNEGAGGGGFGMADIEIGSSWMLERCFQHWIKSMLYTLIYLIGHSLPTLLHYGTPKA